MKSFFPGKVFYVTDSDIQIGLMEMYMDALLEA
jgi:hypothetical protein